MACRQSILMRVCLMLRLLVVGVVVGGVLLAGGGCAARARTEPAPAWEVVGASVRGAPIVATTIEAPGGALPARLLLVGGIHGNEPEGLAAVDPIARMLGDEAPGVRVRIIRDLNPDGTAARTRGNARGVDLNRNFPASNFTPARQRGASALSEPESAVLAREIESFGADVVVVFHSIARGPFVNFDGPGEGLARAFAAAAGETDARWHVVASMGYPTPGSLGTFVGVDRGVPILTVEFRRGQARDEVVAAAVAGVRAVARLMAAREGGVEVNRADGGP